MCILNIISRAPQLEFKLDEATLTDHNHKPALESLFQAPPTRVLTQLEECPRHIKSHIISRAPRLTLAIDEASSKVKHHKPHFISSIQRPPTRKVNAKGTHTHQVPKNKLSSRAPMLVHALDEALLKFQYHKPAFKVLA